MRAPGTRWRAHPARCSQPITALRTRAQQPVPAGRVGDDVGAVERRAQHRRVRDLAADAAADAGLSSTVAPGRCAAGRGSCLIDSDGQPERRMQEWSPVQVSASTPKRSRTTRLPRLTAPCHQRLHAALAVEHALGLRDDHLGAASPSWSAPRAARRACGARRRCGRSAAPSRTPTPRTASLDRMAGASGGGCRRATTRRSCPPVADV